VVQVIPKLWINAKDRERQLMNEYKALQKLDSPFCVKLHAALQNSDALFFLMDYVGGLFIPR
jgi:serine/threonine protein kinase